MKERLAEILALRSVVDALQQEDMVKVLGEVTILSDEYLPVLEFLMAPENLTCLVSSMLQEPTLTAKATAAAAREPGETPSYEEYAVSFRAHWVLCGSGFSHQLLAAMSALKGEPRALIARTFAEFNSRDSMTLEAFARFLTAFMDQYSPQVFMSLFDASIRQQKTFLESLVLLIFYEPLRDTMVRLCNELQGADAEPEVDTLIGLALLQLSPMNPTKLVRERVHERLHQRVAKDIETVRFARMVFTCDLLTDLIHEKREGSLGFAMILSLSESGPSAEQLIEVALCDLRDLPTEFANESYALKVLNSLLQQSQCGCVTKAAFCRASAVAQEDATQEETALSNDPFSLPCTRGSPHEDLPLIWQVFLRHLSTVLSFFSSSSPVAASLQWRFKPTHVQLVYLMLPVLNVSCAVADTLVTQTRTLDALLELITRFPKASILHCAIARLFIVALEDSPYMFGKELPAFRSPIDPLRLHLLLGGALDFVLQSFGWTSVPQPDGATPGNSAPTKTPPPPPAFLDVAISLDQALTSAFAHSAQLFMGNSAFERWKVFRLVVLLPIQTVWEEQYQPPPAIDMGPSPLLTAMLYGEGGHNQSQEDTPTGTKHHKDRKHSSDGIVPVRYTITEGDTSTTQPVLAETSSKPEVDVSAQPEAPTAALTQDANKAVTPGPCAAELISQPAMATEVSAPVVHDVPTPLAALYNEEEKRLMLKVSDDTVSSSPPIELVVLAAVPQTT